MLNNNSRKLHIKTNRIYSFMLFIYISFLCIIWYFYYIDIHKDYVPGLSKESRWFAAFIFLTLAFQLMVIGRVCVIYLDRNENQIVQWDVSVLYTQRHEYALSQITSVIMRRSPTVVFGRVSLAAPDFEIELTLPGFALPSQKRMARDFADFLGVPITDERGYVIPYSVFDAR